MRKLFTLPLFFIQLGQLGQARKKKKGHVKASKKIDQDLGFVPLITARNLARRQKNVKTTLQEEILRKRIADITKEG